MEYENVIVMEKLKRLNKGFNFFNFVQTEKKYYLNVNLKITQDLKDKDELLEVDTNLYISSGYYRQGYSVVDFLKDLETFCNKPFGEVISHNKKGYGYSGNYSYSSYGNFSEIERVIRKDTFKFSDIKIEIGDLAREKLKEMNIDFEEQVKSILKKQKDITKDRQDKINQYVILREKIYMFKSLIKEDDGYSYSSKPKDYTNKIMLSPIEYNSNLKEVEVELRKLEKYFGIDEMRLDYIQIKEELTFEEWKKNNDETLRENFKQAQEESDESETTFDEYCELVFENGGLNEEDEFEDEDEEEEQEE